MYVINVYFPYQTMVSRGIGGKGLVQFVLLVGYHGQHGHLRYLRPLQFTHENIGLRNMYTNHGYIDHKGSTSQLPTTSGYEPFPRMFFITGSCQIALRIIPQSDYARRVGSCHHLAIIILQV
jgi:hypothetical protein